MLFLFHDLRDLECAFDKLFRSTAFYTSKAKSLATEGDIEIMS